MQCTGRPPTYDLRVETPLDFLSPFEKLELLLHRPLGQLALGVNGVLGPHRLEILVVRLGLLGLQSGNLEFRVLELKHLGRDVTLRGFPELGQALDFGVESVRRLRRQQGAEDYDIGVNSPPRLRPAGVEAPPCPCRQPLAVVPAR